MTQKAPGKAHRQGISIFDLQEMFPTEQVAVEWFENIVWGDERRCGHCDGTDTYAVRSGKPMPYRCRECKRYFSVKTGTVMAGSPLPVRKWVYAIYFDVTNLKGVSSMKLHRDIGVCQKTAWFMQQRIRTAFASLTPNGGMTGPVEVDETYIGGKERNKHASKKLNAGRGTVGKTAVVGARDRATGQVSAQVVPATDAETLQSFVEGKRVPNAPVFTDGATAYDGLGNREKVTASASTCGAGCTRTGSSRSRPCLSAGTWAPTIGCRTSICSGTSPSSPDGTTSATWTPPTRWHNVAAAMVGQRLMWSDLTDGPRGYAT